MGLLHVRRLGRRRGDELRGRLGRGLAWAGVRRVGAAAGTRLLDVGAVAVAAGARVTAVDAEPDMVAFAARAAPDADVRLATLPHLPFADGELDAVVGNFVLNHVGRPRAAPAELRRVTRVGGRIAATVWRAPPAAGQTLLGRAVEAAGASRPAHLVPLAQEDDFPRTERGLAELFVAAGLTEVTCETVAWEHRVTAGEWWSGPGAGAATVGQIVTAQPPAVVAEIKARFTALSAEFAGPGGVLTLPHAALLAVGVPSGAGRL
ncbi:methyltransferase domain-containing protein [Streptomyces hainanensis]|uniref:Methyltransferase domain-containing protein n=1 Tax=Streptomyces hainanensis TaxID=402648 RepID=A0A4R4TIV9_9ACTN|nr:methyltransferase domain-containing protein [Streptomyces hainanensis]